MARFIASNMATEPTKIPWTRMFFIRMGTMVISAEPPVRMPIIATRPPTLTARSERLSVPVPPTSTTKSTPSPPVRPRTALSHSGVVL